MNKTLIRSIIALSAVVILGGCIFIGGKSKKDKIEQTDSFKVTSAEVEKIDLIFDAKKLESADKDNIDEILKKKGEGLDKYTFTYGNNDLLFVDDNNKCLSLSLSTVIKEKKLDTADKNKIMAGFGIDLEGATCKENTKEIIYSGVKNYNGEIKFSYNDNNELETIVFYPNGSKAAEDFKNTINTKNNSSVAVAKEPKKEDNKATTTTNSKTQVEQKLEALVTGEENNDEPYVFEPEVLTEETKALASKLRANDKDFIGNIEKTPESNFVWANQEYHSSDSSTVDMLVGTWGIERGDYIGMVYYNTNARFGRASSLDFLIYFVEVNSGNVIMIPDYEIKDAYQIKDGEKVKSYSPLNVESGQWR